MNSCRNKGLNMENNISRTIKAQYNNTSVANFFFSASFGATGVMAIYET